MSGESEFRDLGICYIKSDFLITDNKTVDSKDAKNEADNNNVHLKRAHPDGTVEEEHDPEKKVEKSNDGQKNKSRGQNKNRPVFREERSSNLCSVLFNGPPNSGIKCEYPNCVYIHDVEQYMKQKPADIGNKCYIYSVKGFCSRGLTCRFASSHVDENFNNLKADFYNENIPPSTFNGIKSDLQVKLRKRNYNFDKTIKIVQYFERLRNEENKTKKENESSKASTNLSESNHRTGCVLDTDVIKERSCEVKKVDFRNKIILSPLTTVGNLPFRRICKEYGADITCGEMACAVPIVKGLSQEWALTKRHECEDIFGVQICGNNAKLITQAVQLIQENANIDFVDLNIGCPIDLIYEQGGGSALIRRQNVLQVTVQSCSKILENIPFNVKTRTGIYANKSVAHELLPKLEEWGASAVTLHGRSREQRYTKSANWEYIEECASKVKSIPVIGNGDILNFEDYNEKKKLAPHVSSVMIGRGALIKPWIFKEIKEQKHLDLSSKERYEILQKYVNYGLEHWGSDNKGVETTRRFLLEWLSFLYRYVPFYLLELPPQKINQRPQKYHGRDDLETLMSSNNCNDWIKISEMLLGPVPDGFTFLPKHKANSYL